MGVLVVSPKIQSPKINPDHPTPKIPFGRPSKFFYPSKRSLLSVKCFASIRETDRFYP